MSTYRLTHLDDVTLLRDLSHLVAQDRATSAALLAHIAEVDARRLYLPAAYSSMFSYCVGELRFSEDAAYKRIQAARAARAYPRLLEDLAAGRLHLAAVCLLAPHLAPENVDELVTGATHRRKAEIEAWLAGRFPPAGGAAVPSARIIALRSPAGAGAPAPVPAACAGLGLDALADPVGGAPAAALATAGVSKQLAPGQVVSHVPVRFVVQVPIDERTHAKLRRAQALLGHAVPSGDLARLLDGALDALLLTLERRKAAATEHPRLRVSPAQAPAAPRPTEPRSRAVPASVRRAVWARDGGRCTFTSSSGRRCASRRALEFDHVVPFARGGESTVAGLRLRCRGHNQFEAERAFGSAFMRRKRAGSEGRVRPLIEIGDRVGAP